MMWKGAVWESDIPDCAVLSTMEKISWSWLVYERSVAQRGPRQLSIIFLDVRMLRRARMVSYSFSILSEMAQNVPIHQHHIIYCTMHRFTERGLRYYASHSFKPLHRWMWVRAENHQTRTLCHVSYATCKDPVGSRWHFRLNRNHEIMYVVRMKVFSLGDILT